MEVPRRERLNEFFRRLLAAPNAGTFDEALQQVVTIMNAVEDELTGTPNLPPTGGKTGACTHRRWTTCVRYPGIRRYSDFVPRATTSS